MANQCYCYNHKYKTEKCRKLLFNQKLHSTITIKFLKKCAIKIMYETGSMYCDFLTQKYLVQIDAPESACK